MVSQAFLSIINGTCRVLVYLTTIDAIIMVIRIGAFIVSLLTQWLSGLTHLISREELVEWARGSFTTLLVL